MACDSTTTAYRNFRARPERKPTMFRFPLIALSITAAAFSLAVAGCSDRPRNVPSAAQLTVEGKDRVAYTADREGTIWVSDEGNHKVLYSTQVHAGDRLELNA